MFGGALASGLSRRVAALVEMAGALATAVVFLVFSPFRRARHGDADRALDAAPKRGPDSESNRRLSWFARVVVLVGVVATLLVLAIFRATAVAADRLTDRRPAASRGSLPAADQGAWPRR